MQIRALPNSTFHTILFESEVLNTTPNFAHAVTGATDKLHDTLSKIEQTLDRVDGMYNLTDSHISAIETAYADHYSLLRQSWDLVTEDTNKKPSSEAHLTEELPKLIQVSPVKMMTILEHQGRQDLAELLNSYKSIYSIPVNDGEFFEDSGHYLVNNLDGTSFILHLLYDDNKTSITDFEITNRDYHVGLLEYEGDFNHDFIIPKGSYIFNWYPSYQQLIALSPDLTRGGCTYSPESDVLTNDPELADLHNIPYVDSIIHDCSHEFIEAASDFDIVSTCN